MAKKKKSKSESESKEKPPTDLTGEELYLALQKQWANSFTMRRKPSEGKTREK